MDTLIHADIFFFITAIAVVLITVFFVTALVYVVKILVDLRYIVRRFRQESDLISHDLAELRARIRQEGFKFKRLFDFFSGIWRRKRRSRNHES